MRKTFVCFSLLFSSLVFFNYCDDEDSAADIDKEEESCQYTMMTAPNGCLEIPIEVPGHKLIEIYFMSANNKSVLYQNNGLTVPKGFLINQMLLNDSIYILCGLDFVLDSELLYFKYNQQSGESSDVEFCFKIFKDITVYEHTRYRPLIFPQRYSHEFIYMDHDQEEAFIDTLKYNDMYRNIKKIKIYSDNNEEEKSITINEKQQLKTYEADFKDLKIIIGPIEVIYQRKNNNSQIFHVVLYWSDTLSSKDQVTAFQICQNDNIIITSFDKDKIAFDFAGENNYMMTIYLRGYTEYFCGDSIKETEDWCKENINSSDSFNDSALNENQYILPEYNHKFAVIVYTIFQTGSNSIAPIHRYYLDFENTQIYSFHESFIEEGYFDTGNLIIFGSNGKKSIKGWLRITASFYMLIIISSLFLFFAMYSLLFWHQKKSLINFSNTRLAKKNGKRKSTIRFPFDDNEIVCR